MRVFRSDARAALRALALVLALAPAACGGTPRETLLADGLLEPVEIRRDRFGVAHIYARNEQDLFFAQGWNAARDRLFQLELWRRRATGTLAELLGPRALAGDIGARLLRFRGDLDAELAHYHPRGAAIVEAFVAGVNARIAYVADHPQALPFALAALGVQPGRWTPEVVVSRHNGLYRNARAELAIARLVARRGSAEARRLLDLKPPTPALKPAPGVELTAFGPDVLELYRAARARIAFEPGDVLPAYRAQGAAAAGAAPDPPAPPGGSNAWAVSGARTASGLPLLANDPHRSYAVPSLRYLVHLVGPGWNVIGGGEPALPGVAIGHNEHGAFGLTVFAVDQEDLVVYDTDPDRPDRYRSRGRLEPFRVEQTLIAVRGEAPVRATLEFTRHGPVLYRDPEGRRAVALRAAWLERGGAPYLASLRLDQASSLAAFRAACAAWHTPSENLVWADRDGHVAWQATGLSPVRDGFDGLLPAPGDGRAEWLGYLPASALPHRVDPPHGFVASANEYNLPPGYPHAIGYQWAAPFRLARLDEVLRATEAADAAAMAALQTDVVSLPARALVPLLRKLPLEGDAARAARERLLAWDHALVPDSAAAAIYAVFERRVRENLRDALLPEPDRELLDGLLSHAEVVRRLERPDAGLGADADTARDQILATSLAQAVAELGERFGPDAGGWRYGDARLKHIALRHPLSPALAPRYAARLDVGPLPLGGNGSTVNMTGDTDNARAGPSLRIVADTDDWDRSLAMNTPGQSGDPGSPHYRDLLPRWARGRAFPLAFSRARVEAETESIVWLEPAGGADAAP